MLRKINERLKNSRGQSMLEYILIVIFVVVVGLGVWKLFGQRIKAMVSGASDVIVQQVNDATQSNGQNQNIKMEEVK